MTVHTRRSTAPARRTLLGGMLGGIAPLAGIAALAGALLLAGCDSSSPDSDTAAPSPSVTSASATPTETGSPAKLPECTQVITAGANLADSIAGLGENQATARDVTSALDQLVNAVKQAQTTLSGTIQARLQALESSLENLRQSLDARPVSLDAVRTAGEQAASALLGVASVCTSPTPTG